MPSRTSALLQLLTGGDRRSIGRANEVVAAVLREPDLFGGLFAGLYGHDPLVNMRAADALEKITAERPALLQPHKAELLRFAAVCGRPNVRWHIAQMLPRLALAPAERSAALDILKGYLGDGSSIVKTCALQAIAELAERDERFRAETIALLEASAQAGTPAMRARGKHLLQRFQKNI
jgi:hypothetical protein